MVKKEKCFLSAASGGKLLYKWLHFTKVVCLASFLHEADHIKRNNYYLKGDVDFLITPKLKSACECTVNVRRKIKEWEFFGGGAY